MLFPARSLAFSAVAFWQRLAVGMAGLLMLLVLSQTLAHAAPPQVGEVVFLVGKAELHRDGQIMPLVKAGQISEGDWIVTAADGHVHLRMQDDAFVAVRPASRLQVRQYRYEPASPTANAILLHLEGGTARTVSGRAGEANRERYRFTTPVAAIGLRGTDYVVFSQDELTRVNVLRGAIVLNPLGPGCAADLQHACQTAHMRELSAHNPNAWLELRVHGGTTEIIQRENGVNGASNETAQQPARAHPLEPQVRTEKEVLQALQGDATPALPPPAKIAWGRWQSVALETPTVASQMEGREITYANKLFGLMRPRGPHSQPSGGIVDLNYAAGEAWLEVQGGQLLPVALSGGNLQLDFNRRQFSTQLNATAPAQASRNPGQDKLLMYAHGNLSNQGLFNSLPTLSNMNVAGAISNQANEAGYVFDSKLPVGTLYGVTHWKR